MYTYESSNIILVNFESRRTHSKDKQQQQQQQQLRFGGEKPMQTKYTVTLHVRDIALLVATSLSATCRT